MGRSPWGSVRKLPSGRFQARYCIDLVWHNAPTTFRTKREADAYLASVRADVDRGSWIDPGAGKVTFEEYSSRWLAERPPDMGGIELIPLAHGHDAPPH